MRWTIEVLEIAKCQDEAVDMLIGLCGQVGYLGGRVFPPSPSKPTWRVQAFMENNGMTSGWLPDGCHYRLTPKSLLTQCLTRRGRGR